MQYFLLPSDKLSFRTKEWKIYFSWWKKAKEKIIQKLKGIPIFQWNSVRWKCEFEEWLKLRYDWPPQFKIYIFNRFLGIFLQNNGCVAAVHIEHLLLNLIITQKSCALFSFFFGCKVQSGKNFSFIITKRHFGDASIARWKNILKYIFETTKNSSFWWWSITL